MKLQEFIVCELKSIARFEVNQYFDNTQSKIVKYNLDSLLSDFDSPEYDELLATIKKDKQLSILKSLRWHIEQLVKIKVCYGNLFDLPSSAVIEADLIKINEIIKSQPGNKLLPLFWVIFNKESLIAEESFKEELVSFYDVIFNRYSHLVVLEDFFKETDLLNPNIIFGNNESKYSTSVLEKAVIKFPQKNAMKKALGMMHFQNQNYKDSLEILEMICDLKSIDEKINNADQEDYFYFYDYLDTMQLIALCYEKMGETEKAIKYVNYVLDYVGSEKKGQKDVFSFIDCYLLRIRYSLHNGLYQLGKTDFEEIKGFLDIDSNYWYKEYADVFEKIEKAKSLVKYF